MKLLQVLILALVLVTGCATTGEHVDEEDMSAKQDATIAVSLCLIAGLLGGETDC